MSEPRSEPGGPDAGERSRIDGPSLARAFADGAAALREQADALNAINVFPCPMATPLNMSSP
jgi:dihydroxyacetone kinase-like predicted kinase